MAAVLGVMILGLAALVALVVALQTAGLEARLHLVKVILAGLAHQQETVQLQQVVAVAEREMWVGMAHPVFLATAVLVQPHPLQGLL